MTAESGQETPTPSATAGSSASTGTFGVRLAAAMKARGPLCVGIDPHPSLLDAWGLSDDAAGLERFSLTVVEALGEQIAILKPQVALYERHGSRGIAVLEKTLAAAAEIGTLTIADAKRGDIGSTMAAYADAFVGEGSPLAADAVTASAFLGFESLRPLLDLAAKNDRGVFVLALTSNPQGPQVQHARASDGRTVAQIMLDSIAQENATASANGQLGSIGAVVGATIDEIGAAHDLNIGGPLLAPGFGAQGAGPEQLRAVFGSVLSAVLPSSSRQVLAAGPSASGLRAAAEQSLTEVVSALDSARAV